MTTALPFAAAALLIACVGCTGSASTPTLAPPTPTATVTVEPAPPAPKGTLRVGVVGLAPHRDMHTLVSEWATLFGPGPSYGRLMRFSLAQADVPTLEVECDLCESWRFVDDVTAEFTLSPQARWQPQEGIPSRPVTPQDVVFSLDRMRSPGFPHAVLLDSVAAIEPSGERTVRFELRFPDPDLPLKLASPYAVIVAPEALDGVDLRTGGVVGSGPWLFQQGASGQVALTAWESHATGTNTRRVEFHISASREVAVRQLRLGRVDMTQAPNEEWPTLAEEGFSSEVVMRSGRGVIFGLNSARPPFDDKEVRRAAFLAMDPGAALDETFRIGAVSTGLPLAERTWALSGQEIDTAFADPASARTKLDASGSQKGFTLVVANFGETYVAHGRLLASQLAEAGFDVEVEVLSRAAYLDRIWVERDYEAFVGPMPPVDTPNAFLLGLAHSGGVSNVTGGTAALDALIERQAVELDGAVRAELARKIQRTILDEALFFMAASSAERWVFNDRVERFVPYMPMGAGDLWASIVAVDDEGA